jgi:hypothetical protein
MAIAGEAGELVAVLQWMTDAEIAAALNDDDFKSQLGGEIADVLNYLVRLADVCKIQADRGWSVAAPWVRDSAGYGIPYAAALVPIPMQLSWDAP